MNPSYSDILEATNIEPVWYMRDGVPRFGELGPQWFGVYAKFGLFAKIACQGCGKPFTVGEDWDGTNWEDGFAFTIFDIAPKYHYGDPPAHGCIGDSMNCIDIEIVAAWERSRKDPFDFEWHRVKEIEGLDIRQDWAKGYGEE